MDAGVPSGDPDVPDQVKLVQSRPLIYMKAYYFVSFCYFATYYRYLTLYFEHDGLGAGEIGFLWSVSRVISTLTTPAWSALADRTKRARTMSQVSLVLATLPFLMLAVSLDTPRLMPRAAALWAFIFVGGPASSLRDALALAGCQNADDWGRARVYGAIGWGATHFVLGPLMQAWGPAVIFVSNILCAFMLFMVTRVSVPEACGKKEAPVTATAVLAVLRRNSLFFANITALGSGFAMVEGMLFLLLRELKASELLCGLSVVVTVLFELPIFHYAKHILDRMGTKNMLLLGQAAWVVRAFFYATMKDAWSVLLIEPLHGVTFALVWTAALQHMAMPHVSGEGLEASAQGLLSVCFMGIGAMLGLSVGGLLFETIGSHAAYAVFAIVILLSGLSYWRWGDAGGEWLPSEASTSQPVPMSVGKAKLEHEADVQP